MGMSKVKSSISNSSWDLSCRTVTAIGCIIFILFGNSNTMKVANYLTLLGIQLMGSKSTSWP